MRRCLDRFPAPAVLAALAALALAACRTPTPAESRRATIATIDETYAETRDAVDHGGPTLAEVPAEYREAFIAADDRESQRVALVRLVDRTGDRHASVRTADHARLVAPAGTRATRLDNRAWIELPDSGGSEGPNWVRIETVDGYRPVMAKSAIQLLLGPPGTSVEISGTTTRGEAVTRRLARDGDRRGRIDESRKSFEREFDREFERSLGIPESEANAVAYARRLGPEGAVGYLRIRALNSGPPCDAEACRAGDGCRDRIAIAKAVAEIEPCPIVILDLQGNSGGTCHHAGEVMRTLLPPDLERVPFRHEGEDPADSFPRWAVEPASKRRERSFIVLVDDRTASAAEHIPAILAGRPGVTVVGTPTCGCEHSTIVLRGRDDTRLTFGGIPSAWDPGFTSVEGRPIRPDIEVPLDRDTLERSGPFAAAERRRRDILEEGFRLVGLDPAEVLPGGTTRSTPPETGSPNEEPPALRPGA